jgi:hypothetical protein
LSSLDRPVLFVICVMLWLVADFSFLCWNLAWSDNMVEYVMNVVVWMEQWAYPGEPQCKFPPAART